jgi:hypothetical protein
VQNFDPYNLVIKFAEHGSCMKTNIIFYEFLEYIEEHDGLRKRLKTTLETDGL